MASNPTNMSEGDFISYLAKHGISETRYDSRKNEVSFPCPFSGCDDDHRGGEEFHCNFNCENCTYHCFKCGEDGNYITLRKHFGDYEEYDTRQKAKWSTIKTRPKPSLESEVQKIFKNTHESEIVRNYFNNRGINNESISKFMLGIGKLGGYKGFIIPIFDRNGKMAYVKIRRTPEDDGSEQVAKALGEKNPIPKYRVYPAGAKILLVGEDQLAKTSSTDVLICEGELDRIIATQEGVKIPVVTGGGGAQTFKDEWIDSLKNMRNIYICMDRDETGESGANKLADRIAVRIPTASIYKILLPFKKGTHADLTDYFTKRIGTADELLSKYAEFCCGAKPIDVAQFKEMTVEDIAGVLDSTIKYDYLSKTVTFLAMILAYTESDQLNIMFNADSSTGKTYICTEVGKLFPPQDVKIFGKTTPTAFYYSKSLGRTDEKTGQPYVDLERLILIFTEQPDTKLQENLRSVLSHDTKRTPFALTNKSKNGRNAADEGYILGFPSAFFCSANMKIDEQEQTRCLILSPESTREKLMASIDASIAKNSDKDAYNAELEGDQARRQLMERILYIKCLNAGNIDIDDSEYLKKTFMKDRKAILPKTQREISHFISLVKAMALINAPFRMVDGKIVATNKDVDEAAKLWKPLSICMSYGVSPHLFNFYKTVVLPVYYDKADKYESDRIKGVTIKEIIDEVFRQTGSLPNPDNLRKQYIPALEAAALIACEKDEYDKRQKLIVPLVLFDRDLEEKV